MRITKHRLRRIIQEEIKRIGGSPPKEDWPSEESPEMPDDIKKSLEDYVKIGVPATPVYDPQTDEWRVEELN